MEPRIALSLVFFEAEPRRREAGPRRSEAVPRRSETERDAAYKKERKKRRKNEKLTPLPSFPAHVPSQLTESPIQSPE
jgi:hypothetical protein